MKTTKKILSCLLAALILAGILTGCQGAPLVSSEPLVIKDSDTYIVIKTTKEAMGDKEDMLLIEYMDKLKE